MRRLLDGVFGRKTTGNGAMKEIQTSDDRETASSGREAASVPDGDPDSSQAGSEAGPAPETSVQPDTATASEPADSSEGQRSPEQIKEQIVEQLKTVFDPEIPVNIYEMGLIYDVDVEPDGATRIRMTLTTPMCPAAEELPPEVEGKTRSVEGVTSVQLDLVWEPPWSPDMMSEAARLDLGMV